MLDGKRAEKHRFIRRLACLGLIAGTAALHQGTRRQRIQHVIWRHKRVTVAASRLPREENDDIINNGRSLGLTI
jgi:hypothetical protein